MSAENLCCSKVKNNYSSPTAIIQSAFTSEFSKKDLKRMTASFYSGKIKIGDPTLEELCRYATQDRLCQLCVDSDGSRAKEGSVDPLEVPLGPMTRARAKRFKEALHVLIRDAHVEEACVFNSKKETKMVHIIKLNPDLDQEPRSF